MQLRWRGARLANAASGRAAKPHRSEKLHGPGNALLILFQEDLSTAVELLYLELNRLQHTVGINSFVTRSWHFCKVKTCDFINPARRTRVWRPAQLGRSLDDEIEPAKGLARHNRRLAVQDFPRSHEAEVFTKHHSLMSTSSQIEREVTGRSPVLPQRTGSVVLQAETSAPV